MTWHHLASVLVHVNVNVNTLHKLRDVLWHLWHLWHLWRRRRRLRRLRRMYKRRRKSPLLELELLDRATVRGRFRHVSVAPEVGVTVTKNMFTFPLDDLAVMLEQFGLLDVRVVPIPSYVFVVPAPSVPLSAPAPASAKLYPFQREGVARAMRWGRALIADEMGLGKTVQALTLVRHYGGRALIICPSYLTLNWVREGAAWGVELHRIKSSKCPVPAENVVLSYDLAARRVQQLGTFTTVVCDESHYLKSHKTKRTRSLRALVQRTPHAFLLTGTPAANRPVELYSQVSMLQPACWSTYTHFVERYCGAKRSPLGFVDVSGATHKEELAFRLREVCMIRRLKRDVLNLPPKVRARVDLETKGTADIRRGMARWREINALEPLVPQDLVLERQCLVSELYRLTGDAKADAVRKYLLDLPANVIIFAYHQKMLDVICATLECIRIDGRVPMDQRQPLLDRFVAGDVPYAALGISAAGTGLTITSCSTVIFAELYYVPGALLQAEDRCHRIGQTSTVDVRYLCATNTLDDHLWSMIQKKLRVTDACLDARDDRSW